MEDHPKMKSSIRKLVSTIRCALQNHITGIQLRLRIRLADDLKIIIGAASTHQDGWISTNAIHFDLLKPAVWTKHLGDRKVSAILAEHVWEHLNHQQAQLAAKTCHSYLKKGGRLRVAVPDGYFPNQLYIDQVKPGGSGPGSEDHKILYTYLSLKKLFEDTGFQVHLLEYFDENGRFHNHDWAPEDGMISRSARFDHRNSGSTLGYTSIILDAIK